MTAKKSWFSLYVLLQADAYAYRLVDIFNEARYVRSA
jgi:hypothetical protein